jgi:hypothetical protein
VSRFAKQTNLYNVHLVFTYAPLEETKARTLKRSREQRTRLLCPQDIETIHKESVHNLMIMLDSDLRYFDSITILHSFERPLKLFAKLDNSTTSEEFEFDSEYGEEFEFLCDTKLLKSSKLCLKSCLND